MKKHMHIKVEETLLESFDTTCQQHGLDRSEAIRNLMFSFVNKYKKEVIPMKKELLKNIRKNSYIVAHFDATGKVLDFRAAPTGFAYDYSGSAFAVGFEHDPTMTAEELDRRIEREAAEYGKYMDPKDQFSEALDFSDYNTLCKASEIVHEEAGDITWYITKLPDGRWAAWDDAELTVGRVSYHDSREKAVAYQQSGIDAAEL